ncbi:DUF2922 domain-containing protein [Peribacillus saganii]|uniref:DUF2922 domain-containing protein n=1 Tax=Peribacillus saganii TaxID=2303992 RepID=A0A372LS21_9BACI|nr:DUF2922 domain-containing protein [Peribacillus saganii]RFU70978.1 DUF2922 domain-containing protein [Peribacillus saganii]
MAKTLELIFVTEEGKTSAISIEDPKEPVNIADVKMAMEQVVAAQAFTTQTGGLASVKGARVIERNVTDYEVK